MHLSEDQVWKLNEIVNEVGYNNGFIVKHPFWRRRDRPSAIRVFYADQNRIAFQCTVSTTGDLVDKEMIGRV